MKILLPNFIGMIFMGLMVLLVGAIYFCYGRRMLGEADGEEQYAGQGSSPYYGNSTGASFAGGGLDRTMVRGLEETRFFQPEGGEPQHGKDVMQNTLVMPMMEKGAAVQEESPEMDLSSVVEAAAAAAMTGEGQQWAVEVISAPAIEPMDMAEKAPSKNDPQPFGSQTCWIAIHAKHMKEVAEILEIEEAHSCDWQSGLAASTQNDGSVFITPPIGEWVLVIGRSILKKVGLDYPIDGFKWIKEVSEQFGLVYYFCTHQKAQYQAWVKADRGEVERAYAYSGKENEVFWEWGDMTNTESALLRSLEAVYGNQVIDEAVVLALAAKWTVDTSFRNVTNVSGPGILGVLN